MWNTHDARASRRRRHAGLVARASALLIGCCIGAGAWAANETHVEIEGVPFPETAVVDGTKLVLNGVAVNKRAYFKSEAVGLYLPQKMQTADAVMKAAGPKRLRLVMLRDAPGWMVSRYFVSDFKRWATDNEFKQLINELGQVGALYANVKSLNKGDEILIDWVPAEGIVSYINGKRNGAAVKSELFFTITCLRPIASPEAPQDAQKRLLGQVPMPTAPGPYPEARAELADSSR